ncbi:hypothetical protein HOY80DRAFT_1004524 [Tuber brumale]|nr:hypothetical protein HOY80DRAFT_1004524 [Tuber brumale]
MAAFRFLAPFNLKGLPAPCLREELDKKREHTTNPLSERYGRENSGRFTIDGRLIVQPWRFADVPGEGQLSCFFRDGGSELLVFLLLSSVLHVWIAYEYLDEY